MRGKERSMNRVGRILGLTVMAIGLLTVLSGLGDMAKSKLAGASAVAVLSSGEIAVAVASKQQIQLYSAEGHFLKDVTVDSGPGGIRDHRVHRPQGVRFLRVRLYLPRSLCPHARDYDGQVIPRALPSPVTLPS